MKSIELITIPAIAKPLPFVLFLLHKISPSGKNICGVDFGEHLF